MAIANRIKSFLSSPKGQQVISRGRQELSKPQNQQKIRALLNRVNKKR
ncbi:MAG TPA: hypothetical protein VF635_14730 [Propionibacteriaceae bacterium]